MYDKTAQKKYRAAHSEERARNSRDWRISNPRKVSDYKKRWDTANPETRAFVLAKQRCTNRKHPYYDYYGGRGIKFVYASSSEMIADIGFRPSKEYSLDRIDNNGDYRRGNCRWATRSEQMLNRRKYKHTRLTARYIGSKV